MTPKEKAEQIWMKLFQKQIEVTGNGDGNLCVEMALIAVDEILKSGCTLPCEYGYGDNEDATKWWQEVKQEIEKL